jgi:hypothetical protein
VAGVIVLHRVFNQSPGAGSMAPKGATIDLGIV